MLGREARDTQADAHSYIIGAIHGQLFKWKGRLLTGWEDDGSHYRSVYYKVSHTPASKFDSAFYLEHYIKWFDGAKLTFTMDEHKAPYARMATLYNLMTMEGNKGWKPAYMCGSK